MMNDARGIRMPVSQAAGALSVARNCRAWHLACAALVLLATTVTASSLGVATLVTGWSVVSSGGGALTSGSVRLAGSSIGQPAAGLASGGGITLYSGISAGQRKAFLDLDGDGLTAAQEQSLGTSLRLADTDEDGVSDFDEVGADGIYSPGIDTDPLNEDTDGDGILDGDDPMPLAGQARQIPALPWWAALLLLGAVLAGARTTRGLKRAGVA